LPAGHDADELHDALTGVLVSRPAELRLTLTWDQGGEMARHAEISELLAGGVFFADPASPWQRGTNEISRPSKSASTIDPARSSAGRPLPK